MFYKTGLVTPADDTYLYYVAVEIRFRRRVKKPPRKYNHNHLQDDSLVDVIYNIEMINRTGAVHFFARVLDYTRLYK